MSNDFEKLFAKLTAKTVAEVEKVIQAEAEALAEAQREALAGLLQSPEDSGDLMASIGVRDGEHPWEKVVHAGGKPTTGEVREGSGVDFDHGAAFEFGTSRQPARPFFFNTYEERREQIEQNITKAAEKALKE